MKDLLYERLEKLLPMHRTLASVGNLATLWQMRYWVPFLKMRGTPSGISVFDWTVPEPWNPVDAHILDVAGHTVVSMWQSPLHVVQGSDSVQGEFTFDELRPHLHTLPEKPDAIPYRTNYYADGWGFCLQHDRYRRMEGQGPFTVKVEASRYGGALPWGEIVVEGRTDAEVLVSTYTCHPAMANDNTAGIVLALALAEYAEREDLHYTYRFAFVPETIGALCFLDAHPCPEKTVAGFALSCIGDDGPFTVTQTPSGDTLADRVASQCWGPDERRRVLPYTARGSDERQYAAPNVGLPVVGLARSAHGTYPEYHTSLDDLSVVTPDSLYESWQQLERLVGVLERNRTWTATGTGEPQMGKRGLYPSPEEARERWLNPWSYMDGTRDALEIAGILDVDPETVLTAGETLERHGLVEV